MARDAAKITDHRIADLLALFSMLLPLPLTAGLGFTHYYNCQKDPFFFSRRGHFQYPCIFSMSVIASYVLNLRRASIFHFMQFL
jgi:hypothetical protein